MTEGTGAGTRDRQKPMKVYVSAEERQRIEATAKACGQLPTTYLRNVGLGYEPRSRFDREAIESLAKLHADQMRLGEMLKQCLTGKMDAWAPSVWKVQALFEQIEEAQAEIVRLMMKEARRL